MLRRKNFAVWVGLICTVANAHDFWIEPATFQPKENDLVRVALKVGEHFKGEPVGRTPERIAKFVAMNANESTDVIGSEGHDPAGMFRAKKPGVYVIGYRSTESYIELKAEDFEAYLKEEGIDEVSKLRKERGESDKPGREGYSRAVKSLVNVGPAASSGFDQSLDFPLELFPESNPYTLKVGSELGVRLTFNKKPLANALIVAMPKDKPDEEQSLRSDSQGHVSFKMERPGMWMIKTVHMFPDPPRNRDEGAKDPDWQSLWASLTFEISGEKAEK